MITFKIDQIVNVYGKLAKIKKINAFDANCITVRTVSGKRFNMLCKASEILESVQPMTIVQ